MAPGKIPTQVCSWSSLLVGPTPSPICHTNPKYKPTGQPYRWGDNWSWGVTCSEWWGGQRLCRPAGKGLWCCARGLRNSRMLLWCPDGKAWTGRQSKKRHFCLLTLWALRGLSALGLTMADITRSSLSFYPLWRAYKFGCSSNISVCLLTGLSKGSTPSTASVGSATIFHATALDGRWKWSDSDS